jgi:uncharacterized membrane protein
VASDIETYLRELQAALAGTDPALVQDALFDAEEYLHAEMAGGRTFAEVVDHYGTPQEVAAAYRGVRPATGAAPGFTVGGGEAPFGPAPAQAGSSAPPGPPAAAAPAGPPPVWGPGSGWGLGGTGYAAPPRAPGAASGHPSIWRQVFGVFADAWVWKSLLYMLLALATGTFYFTVVVTLISTSFGTIILVIGLPLLLLTLGLVRGMALFEGRLVELLLGTRMPRRPRADLPRPFFQRLFFWLKDGRTWASLVYLLLMLPLGIVYFTFAVTGLALGLGLIAAPFVQLITGHTWIYWGVNDEWLLPVWATPLIVIAGFLVLLGWFHAFRWIGRGHAAFAKAMLVRLAK